MSHLLQLRSRISTLKNTLQIAHSTKAISAMKMHFFEKSQRAQEEKLRELEEVFDMAGVDYELDGEPVVVAFFSNIGMCGNKNDMVFQQAKKYKEVFFFGERGNRYFQKGFLGKLGNENLQKFMNITEGKRVKIIFMGNSAKIFEEEQIYKHKKIENNTFSMINKDKLLKRYKEVSFSKLFTQNLLFENLERIKVSSGAVNNCETLLVSLKNKYNRLRQEKITSGILEVSVRQDKYEE